MKSYCITLRETVDRWASAYNHFAGHGLFPEQFLGLNAVKWGLTTKNSYDVDHPGTGFHIPQKHVGLHLSHYWLWRQISRLASTNNGSDYSLIMEDDSRYIGNDPLLSVLAEYEDWLKSMEADYRPLILFLGSCNCAGKPSETINESLGIHKLEWPQCTHAYIVNNRAAAGLILSQEKSWAPIDLAMIFNSFPEMKGHVYTVLPRLFDQGTQSICP